jgi:hypothetical protein
MDGLPPSGKDSTTPPKTSGAVFEVCDLTAALSDAD